MMGQPPSSTELVQLTEIEVVVEVIQVGVPGAVGLTQA